MFQGVFLDLYGTITAGDRAAVHAAASRVVDDLRLPVSAERFAVLWGERFFSLIDRSNHDDFRTLRQCEDESLCETVAAMGLAIEPQPYVDMLESYWIAPPLHSEVKAAIERLHVPVCLVSNADTAGALGALAHHGLRFEHVVTSQEARCYKPHGGIFEFALRRTGWPREAVIHVGDSLHSDVKGAKQVGLRTGWVCREERIHDIGETTPDYTFATLQDLADLLNGSAGSQRPACRPEPRFGT